MQPQIEHLDEIEADVECLMCARVIGELFGQRWRTSADPRTARTIANLTTYRDNEPGAQPRGVWAGEQFFCRYCGGPGFIGDILARTLLEEGGTPVCPMHRQPRTGPGRPPAGCRCLPPRLAA